MESAPGPVPGPVVVPAVRGFPDARDAWLKVLHQQVVVQVVDPQAGRVRDGDEPVPDDGLGQADLRCRPTRARRRCDIPAPGSSRSPPRHVPPPSPRSGFRPCGSPSPRHDPAPCRRSSWSRGCRPRSGCPDGSPRCPPSAAARTLPSDRCPRRCRSAPRSLPAGAGTGRHIARASRPRARPACTSRSGGPAVMPSCSEMWPTWSMASGISGPITGAHLGDVLFQQVQALVAEMQAGERMHHVLRVVGGAAGTALFLVADVLPVRARSGTLRARPPG